MPSMMVAGSAAGYDDMQVGLAKRLGRAIAAANCVMVNGATTGLPFFAAREALETDSRIRIIAVSPAGDILEHTNSFRFPAYMPGEILFLGREAGITWASLVRQSLVSLPGDQLVELRKQFQLKFRNVASVAIADAVIAIGGRIGTINELTIASDFGKPIGIVKGGGGNAEEFPALVERSGKQKAPVLIGSPEELVSQILQILQL